MRNSTSTRSLHVVVCLFGVIQRSIRVTWPVIAARVVNHLRQHHIKVSVYVFSLDIGFDRTLVDGCHLEPSDVRLIPYDVLEVERQVDVDTAIDAQCTPSLQKCPLLAIQNVSNAVRRNALRQMYSEAAVGRYLSRRGAAYDIGIVIGPDYYLLRNVSMSAVNKASRAPKSVFTSHAYQAGGYTNGYYIGQIRPLSRILRRAEDFFASRLRVRHGSGYENTLKASFVHYDVWHLVTDQMFFKVRANAALANYTVKYLLGTNRLAPLTRRRMHAEIARLEARMAPVGQHCLTSIPPAQFAHVSPSLRTFVPSSQWS